MNIRPFHLPHDLDLMNELVMQGFDYPENPQWSVRADEKQGMIDRVQGAKRMWPLMRVLQILSPIFRDVMCGFIAEEDGKPVGLINYMRQRDEPEWYIANVTVLPAYRRRGIARALVQAVLDELHKRQARRAILEVVDENLPAVKLYQEMGFEIFTGSVIADLEPGAANPEPNLPVGWTLTPLSRFDWKTRFELAKRITPATVARYEPPVETRYRVPAARVLFGALFMRFGGDDFKRFALRAPSGEIAGFGWYGYRLKEGGVNFVDLALDPACPECAAALVSHSIAFVQSASPGRRVEFELASWQPALIEAALAVGCNKRYGGHRMGLNLQ